MARWSWLNERKVYAISKHRDMMKGKVGTWRMSFHKALLSNSRAQGTSNVPSYTSPSRWFELDPQTMVCCCTPVPVLVYCSMRSLFSSPVLRSVPVWALVR